MNWRYVDEKHIVIGDSLIELPGISTNVHYTTTVVLDETSVELPQAIRVLLAQRSHLQQENADLRERVAALERGAWAA